MDKLKVLFITPHLSTGGAPQYLLKKIQELKDSCSIYCVEYSDITGGVLVVQRQQIKDILGANLITLSNNKNELINIINKIAPNVIHFEEMPEFFCDQTLAKKIYAENRNYKIIETSHDSSFNPDDKLFFPDSFVFVSEYQKNNFSKLNIPSYVVEYPIEPKKRTKNREEALKEFNLDPQKKHIVNVGLFTPRKNQAEIIEYARKLINYPVQFHFIGNQAENFKDYWQPLMENLPSNCIWWGEKRNVDAFYEFADLFLFTSRGTINDKETMPLVIREAISWNLPSLIYNLPVYLNYFDKHNNIKYLDFDSLDNNCQKILKELKLITQMSTDDIEIGFEQSENKITIKNNSDNSAEFLIVIKDYLSDHTIYWYPLSIQPKYNYWTVPCPKDYFFDKVCNHNNFKGYKIDFLYKDTKQLAFTKEIIIDEYATNYERTLAQNPLNCSYMNYVEFFVKKYFDDYDIEDVETFVDLGANDGLVTEWALNRGAKKVYCVEPDKRSIRYLKEKFIDNENVVVVDKAVYIKNEYDVKFCINTDTSTVTSLAAVSNDQKQDFFLAETITLSRFFSDYKIDNVSVMKIDIEGAEFDLLKQMTKEQKDKVKYFLIECHFLNQDKINTVLNAFGEGFELEFRDHLNNNIIVDSINLIKHQMITLFVKNKKLVKTSRQKQIPIEIHHLSSLPDTEREIKSIQSILPLSKYCSYYQEINVPYEASPPKESCYRPNDISNEVGTNKLTSRHYGCYKAHTDAILKCAPKNNQIYLFFEGDAVITIPPEEFLNKVQEAYILCKKYGYNFFSLGPIYELSKTYEDHLSSTKLFEAHAYIIPGEKIAQVQEWIKSSPWDVFDLWTSYVLPKQRFGYFKEYYSLQAKGESLIDKQMSDKNYLGIEKV